MLTFFLFACFKRIGIPEMRDTNNTLSNLIPAGSSGSSSSDVVIQDGKKPTKSKWHFLS